MLWNMVVQTSYRGNIVENEFKFVLNVTVISPVTPWSSSGLARSSTDIAMELELLKRVHVSTDAELSFHLVA